MCCTRLVLFHLIFIIIFWIKKSSSSPSDVDTEETYTSSLLLLFLLLCTVSQHSVWLSIESIEMDPIRNLVQLDESDRSLRVVQVLILVALKQEKMVPPTRTDATADNRRNASMTANVSVILIVECCLHIHHDKRKRLRIVELMVMYSSIQRAPWCGAFACYCLHSQYQVIRSCLACLC